MNTKALNRQIAMELNRDKFNQLTQGKVHTQPRIIAVFIEHTPLLLAELDRALSERLIRKTEQVAHKLKSSCALLCSDALQSDLATMARNAIDIQSPEYFSFGRIVIMRIGKLLHELEEIYKTDRI
jgi:HPt (histidine-containing phosphotransfer) domain-containing protein